MWRRSGRNEQHALVTRFRRNRLRAEQMRVVDRIERAAETKRGHKASCCCVVLLTRSRSRLSKPLNRSDPSVSGKAFAEPVSRLQSPRLCRGAFSSVHRPKRLVNPDAPWMQRIEFEGLTGMNAPAPL